MAEIHFKFVPEQMVWIMYNNKPIEAKINAIAITIEHHSLPAKIEYTLEMPGATGTKICEDKIFATKEELKQSIFG